MDTWYEPVAWSIDDWLMATKSLPATGACLVRRLYSYATGRAPARHDMPWIRYLETSFAADGYRVPELMRRIATSENFYRVGAPATQLVAREGSSGEIAR